MVSDITGELGEVDGCSVLRLRGRLDNNTAAARRFLEKGLLDRGHLIAEVSELTVRRRVAVMAFPAALADAGGWPLARLVLIGAGTELSAALRTVRVLDLVPAATTWPQAKRLLATRPRQVRRRSELPCHPHTPWSAAAAVRECCTDWDIPELAQRAQGVAHELVANAVRHARTSLTMTFTLSAIALHIGVRDHRPLTETEQFLITARPVGAGGMQRVRASTVACGVTPHADGKTVWATIAVDPPS